KRPTLNRESVTMCDDQLCNIPAQEEEIMACQIGRMATLAAQQCTSPAADHQRRALHLSGNILNTTIGRALRHSRPIVAAAALFVAYANDATIAQTQQTVLADRSVEDAHQAIATLRHATARYQDLAAALDDGFVLLHECENRPGEGPVGTVYV